VQPRINTSTDLFTRSTYYIIYVTREYQLNSLKCIKSEDVEEITIGNNKDYVEGRNKGRYMKQGREKYDKDTTEIFIGL
jgi:hypothetical protein